MGVRGSSSVLLDKTNVLGTGFAHGLDNAADDLGLLGTRCGRRISYQVLTQQNLVAAVAGMVVDAFATTDNHRVRAGFVVAGQDVDDFFVLGSRLGLRGGRNRRGRRSHLACFFVFLVFCFLGCLVAE